MSQHFEEVEMRGFYELVGDAFVYPLRGRGKWLLLVGTLFFTVAGWFTIVPLFGLLLALLIAGYLCAYMFRVVGRSAQGDRQLPDWPGFTDLYEDIVYPLLLVVGTALLAFLPAIVLGLGHLFGGWQTETAFVAALVVGLLYLPMALLGVCLNQTFAMAGPHIVIPAILKVPLEYLTVCSVLGVVVVLQTLAGKHVLDRLPLLGGLLGQFLSLYCLVLEMRLLGVLFYTRRERLGWF